MHKCMLSVDKTNLFNPWMQKGVYLNPQGQSTLKQGEC